MIVQYLRPHGVDWLDNLHIINWQGSGRKEGYPAVIQTCTPPPPEYKSEASSLETPASVEKKD